MKVSDIYAARWHPVKPLQAMRQWHLIGHDRQVLATVIELSEKTFEAITTSPVGKFSSKRKAMNVARNALLRKAKEQ